LALCPVLFSQDDVTLRPCIELDAGDLEGQGKDTNDPQTPSLFWLGAAAALHGEIALGRVLALDGQLGARVLAKPGRFVFLPDDAVVHDTGRFSLGALLGLVARLP
jgi:hypothetical protein